MIHSMRSPPGFWGGTHFSGSPPEVPRMGGKQKYFSGSPPEVFILGGNSQIFCFEMPPNPQNFPPAAGKSLPPQTMRGNFQQKTGSPPIVGGNFPPQTSQDWGETFPPRPLRSGGELPWFFRVPPRPRGGTHTLVWGSLARRRRKFWQFWTRKCNFLKENR